MANLIVQLKDGLTIGDVQHTEAEIREYTAGDLIDACSAAEKVVYTENGPLMIASPTMMDMGLIARQIIRIGEHKGPLSLSELRKLSGEDLTRLQVASSLLDAGAAKAAAQRGRSDGSQGTD
mgnify:CR=1 FL=1